MKLADILKWRIARQHLAAEKGADVVAVARRVERMLPAGATIV